jgi:hypothetical protein
MQLLLYLRILLFITRHRCIMRNVKYGLLLNFCKVPDIYRFLLAICFWLIFVCISRYQTSISVYVIPIVYGMIGVARTGSVYLTMSVTLERYFAIVRPLSAFRMKRCLVPISITFAIVYNIPRFFELERYVFKYTNETLVRATPLRENPLYVSIYNTWMKMVRFCKRIFSHNYKKCWQTEFTG